jgi:hypothetical protein
MIGPGEWKVTSAVVAPGGVLDQLSRRKRSEQTLMPAALELPRARDLSPEQRPRIICSSTFMKQKMSPSGVRLKSKARVIAVGDRQDKTLNTSPSSTTTTSTFNLLVCGDAAAQGKYIASIGIEADYLSVSMVGTGVQAAMATEPMVSEILLSPYSTYARLVRLDGLVCARLLKALYGTVARLWQDVTKKVLATRCIHQRPLTNMPAYHLPKLDQQDEHNSFNHVTCKEELAARVHTLMRYQGRRMGVRNFSIAIAAGYAPRLTTYRQRRA